MNDTRRLSLTLCILIVTLMLVLTTLGIVMVSGTQYVLTDIDIHYGGSSIVAFSLSEDCTNASDFNNYGKIKNGEVIEKLPVPTILNKCFTGWYTDANAINEAVFPFTVTEDVTFYPV